MAGDSGRNASLISGVRVRLEGVAKRFGTVPVLHEIDLDVRPGEFVAIVGHSGCGKSTLLRLVAGLETPSAGRVVIGEEPGGVTPLAGGRPGDAAAPAGIRIMFQEARLLPWKRVLDNVRLAVRRPDSERVALAALGEVGLADKATAWPHTLSGGQRQRVALARALASQPRLLLLDEPFGALDALTRLEMQQWVERVWQGFGFTALLVTHDVAEAVALADRIVMLDEGRIAMQREVRLPRPRVKDAAFFRIEQEVLAAVMSRRAQAAATPGREVFGTGGA